MNGDSSNNNDFVWQNDDLIYIVVSQAKSIEDPNYSIKGEKVKIHLKMTTIKVFLLPQLRINVKSISKNYNVAWWWW